MAGRTEEVHPASAKHASTTCLPDGRGRVANVCRAPGASGGKFPDTGEQPGAKESVARPLLQTGSTQPRGVPKENTYQTSVKHKAGMLPRRYSRHYSAWPDAIRDAWGSTRNMLQSFTHGLRPTSLAREHRGIDIDASDLSPEHVARRGAWAKFTRH